MKNIDKRLVEIDNEFQTLVRERQKLIEDNRKAKFDDVNNFLLENLGDIEMSINTSSSMRGKKSIELYSTEEDISEFLTECLELNNVDPTSYQGHFHFYIWDDKVQFYSTNIYSDLSIKIHDVSLLNKFMDEYSITNITFDGIDEKIKEYEMNLKELKLLKERFK